MKFVFPIGVIVLSLGAAAVYAYALDWKHAIYWAAGATMIAAVTF